MIDGAKGYLTIAGKETPKLSLWQIHFSGKTFICMKQSKAEFERHLKSLPDDRVEVTWFHSSEIRLPDGWKGSRRRKKKPEPEEPKPVKKENVDYNVTIQVTKESALAIFDSGAKLNIDLAGKLYDMAENIIRRETIPIDKEIFLLFPLESDIPNIVTALQDREIYENTVMIPYPYTEEDGKKFIEFCDEKRKDFGRTMEWGIHKNKQGLIGMIGFHGRSKDNPEVEEVGYWLAKPYWNQGIMTKVLKKITEFGFEKYGFKRLEMPIFSFNKASIRVAEKCGYHHEKDLHNAYQKDGKSIDAKLFVLGR